MVISQADSDLVFVLDVLDDYKPLVPDRLYVAMDTVETGNWQNEDCCLCVLPSCRSRHTGPCGEGALAGARKSGGQIEIKRLAGQRKIAGNGPQHSGLLRIGVEQITDLQTGL